MDVLTFSLPVAWGGTGLVVVGRTWDRFITGPVVSSPEPGALMRAGTDCSDCRDLCNRRDCWAGDGPIGSREGEWQGFIYIFFFLCS